MDNSARLYGSYYKFDWVILLFFFTFTYVPTINTKNSVIMLFKTYQRNITETKTSQRR